MIVFVVLDDGMVVTDCLTAFSNMLVEGHDHAG